MGSSATEKTADDGNVYTIEWFAMTNIPALVSNVWPKYRQHMDLSIDGGQTWVRRIGYGIQTPKGSTGSEFEWSPPDDYTLLTTRAVLRLVDLDGAAFRGPTNGMGYDVPTNGIRSPTFAICGAVIDDPAEGDVVYRDTSIFLTWRQVGGGETADLYWLTPTTNALLTTVSNVVDGLNSQTVYISADMPITSETRFCVRGVEYPAILGYSGTFEVRP